MPCRVRVTSLAQAQADGLRGPNQKRLEDALRDIERRGCVALDYRLTGSNLLERICVKHLRGQWRAVVVFTEPDVAVLLLIGEHVTDPGRNVYDALYGLIGHEPEPNSGRTKPPCCEDGQPPFVTDPEVDDLVARTCAILGCRR